MTKLIASNTDEKIEAATTEAFQYYGQNKTDVAGTITKISTPLKGVGPAMGSLLLSIHDPENVVFFSDELFRWLVTRGEKASPKYTTKEFEVLFAKAKSFQERIKCTPQELEQVAFVIIKENEPVYEPKPKYVPSGLPRGRPTKPDSEKKPRHVPVPGRKRGRPPMNGVSAKPKPAKVVKPKAEPKSKPATPKKAAKSAPASAPATGEKKKRGRPSAASVAAAAAAAGKKTPTSGKKRKADSETPASSKKAKA